MGRWNDYVFVRAVIGCRSTRHPSAALCRHPPPPWNQFPPIDGFAHGHCVCPSARSSNSFPFPFFVARFRAFLKGNLMKTTIGALKRAIKKALKAVDCASCAIKVESGALSVIAMSAQASVKILVPAQGNAGDCCAVIGAKQAGAILGSVLDCTECTIEAIEQGAQLVFGGARIKLMRPAGANDGIDLFDPPADGDKRVVFETSGRDFAGLMAGPAQYAAKSDVRYYLVGVHATCDAGALRLTGSNGFMLCTAAGAIDASASMVDCIVPHTAADSIGAVFGADERITVCQLGKDANLRLLMHSETIQWNTALVAGKFPDFRRVMPGPKRIGQCKLSRDALSAAVSRVLAASGDVFVALHLTRKGLEVRSVDGEQCEVFATDTSVDKDVRVTVTGQLLVQAIDALETPAVQLSLDGKDQHAKIVLNPVEGTVKDWLGFLMQAKV